MAFGDESTRSALRIALIYVVFALVWIYASDQVLATFATDLPRYAFVQTFKGILFVFVSSGVVFGLYRYEMVKRAHAEDRYEWQIRSQAILLEMNAIVQNMHHADNLEQVTRSFCRLLQDRGLDFQVFVIHFLLDVEMSQFETFQFQGEDTQHFKWQSPKMYDFFKAQQQKYRKDIEVDLDGLGNLDHVRERYTLPIRSTIDIPFATGVLSLLSIRPAPFSDEQVTFIIEMTEVLSTGLRRVEDLAHLNSISQRFQSLLLASQEVVSTLSMSDLFERIVEHLRVACPKAELGAIYIYDAQLDRLVPQASFGYDSQAFLQIRLKPNESISGNVFQTGQSYLSRNQADADRLRGPLDPENAHYFALARGNKNIISNICVPLRLPDQTILGTLTMGAMTDIFGQEDLEVLMGAAAVMAVAIQNARLFDHLEQSQERLRLTSQQLVHIQENERQKLARELHDEIGQALTTIKIDLQMRQEMAAESSLDLADTIETVNNALQQVRSMSLNLRPSVLDDFGIQAALRWLVDRHQGMGPRIDLILETKDQRYPQDVETAYFRVTQEALTNALRHADAKKIVIVLKQTSDTLMLRISDNGRGFDVADARQHSLHGLSTGLLNMEERLTLLGGQIEIVSSPDQGTVVEAVFPSKLLDCVSGDSQI
jgi:signal transduction histidine kinase